MFDQLAEFFKNAAHAEAINTVAIQTLIGSVSLKSQSAAGCLAVIITESKEHAQRTETLW
jgi:hypothetical protein